MSTTYTINYSDTTKTGFTIDPGEFDGPPHFLENPPNQAKIHTSVTLPGRGILNYGRRMNENLVHLLENFASFKPPIYPIEGQLWADTTGATNVLKFVDVQNDNDASPLSVSSLTRSGSVITAVTSTVHGLVNADTVVISGATQSEYNGKWVITFINTTTFTYVITGTPATPATGTIVAKRTHWAQIPSRNPVTPVTGDFQVDIGTTLLKAYVNGAYGIVWTSQNQGHLSGLNADLVDGLHASDFDALYLKKSGDQMSAGFLTLANDPTFARHAVTKTYVDNHIHDNNTAGVSSDIHVNFADRTWLNLFNNTVTQRPIASAWVTFDGTSGAAPVIKRAYKVASVTRNSTSNYTITFDADTQTQLATIGSTTYAVVTGVGGTNASLTTTSTKPTVAYYNMTNVSFKMFAEIDYGSGAADANRISAAIFA